MRLAPMPIEKAQDRASRDLKPANLMLDARRALLKVMDFGIASSIGDSLSRLSKAGAVAPTGGTLALHEPAAGHGLSAPRVADDVYSLGATIFMNCSPASRRFSAEKSRGRSRR